MLEHIVNQDWSAECNVIGMIESNVVVQPSITKIEVQDRPTTTAAKGVGCRTEVLFPFIESSEVSCDRPLHRTRGLSITAQVSEVFLIRMAELVAMSSSILRPLI